MTQKERERETERPGEKGGDREGEGVCVREYVNDIQYCRENNACVRACMCVCNGVYWYVCVTVPSVLQ